MVTVIDDLGNPVAGVTVTGTFTGDYDETHSEATEASGLATLRTDTRVLSPGFGFCVDDVTGGGLTYDAGANVETCDSF